MEIVFGLLALVACGIAAWLWVQRAVWQERLRARELDLEAQAEAQKRLAEVFGDLAAKALAQNNQVFLDLARATLEKYQTAAREDLDHRQAAIAELVKPLGEALGWFQQQYGTLSEQLRRLSQDQAQLQAETANLVEALRSPKVRGRWGEIQLRRVVEMAGMVEYCDFVEQESRDSEQGRLRPDLVVKLPNGKNVVVDAKVSLKAYLEAAEARDEADRHEKLREHARQVRAHVLRLAERRYWEQFAPAPEFVVMFLPGEAFFSAALEQDPELIEFGAESRVLIATPMTLIALLRAVAYGWREARLAESARQISQLGRELHDRLRTMTEHFVRLGRALQSAIDAYNQTLGSLESRVLATARRFRELGAAPSEEIPAVEPVEIAARQLTVGEDPARQG